MSVSAVRGEQYLSRRGFRRALRPGETVQVPAFEHVDLQLAGAVFSPSVCRVTLRVLPVEAPGQPQDVKAECASRRPCLRDRISAWVFQNPQQEWTAASVSSLLGMTRSQIRATLFMQGDALTRLCKTQRLMRALFDSLSCDLSVDDLKVRLGWPDTNDLEASFQEWFGVSLQAVTRLRYDGF